jgi:hypothetical protein
LICFVLHVLFVQLPATWRGGVSSNHRRGVSTDGVRE